LEKYGYEFYVFNWLPGRTACWFDDWNEKLPRSINVRPGEYVERELLLSRMCERPKRLHRQAQASSSAVVGANVADSQHLQTKPGLNPNALDFEPSKQGAMPETQRGPDEYYPQAIQPQSSMVYPMEFQMPTTDRSPDDPSIDTEYGAVEVIFESILLRNLGISWTSEDVRRMLIEHDVKYNADGVAGGIEMHTIRQGNQSGSATVHCTSQEEARAGCVTLNKVVYEGRKMRAQLDRLNFQIIPLPPPDTVALPVDLRSPAIADGTIKAPDPDLRSPAIAVGTIKVPGPDLRSPAIADGTSVAARRD
jgi:hypothetical protein